MYCYFNGKIIKEDAARVSLRDVGLLRGYGVFDLLRTHHGAPLLFNEHFGRLGRSAAALGLTVPLSKTKAAQVVSELLRKNKYKEATVRFVLTGGVSKDSVHIKGTKPTFFILISPFYPLPTSVFARGIALYAREHLREFPEIKSLDYLTALTLHNPKKGAPPLEVLYTFEGRVLEATTSNFFIFSKGTLVTPKRDVLLGTTRNLVLTIARKYFKTKERDISMAELAGTQEAFLTATNKDIVPVISINGRKVGSGRPGERTRQLMAAFVREIDMVQRKAVY